MPSGLVNSFLHVAAHVAVVQEVASSGLHRRVGGPDSEGVEGDMGNNMRVDGECGFFLPVMIMIIYILNSQFSVQPPASNAPLSTDMNFLLRGFFHYEMVDELLIDGGFGFIKQTSIIPYYLCAL